MGDIGRYLNWFHCLGLFAINNFRAMPSAITQMNEGAPVFAAILPTNYGENGKKGRGGTM